MTLTTTSGLLELCLTGRFWKLQVVQWSFITFPVTNLFLVAGKSARLQLYKYIARRRRGDRLCLSAPCQFLLLWSGINHLISPQACLCAVPMIYIPTVQHLSSPLTLTYLLITLRRAWALDVFITYFFFFFFLNTDFSHFMTLIVLVHSLSSISPDVATISRCKSTVASYTCLIHEHNDKSLVTVQWKWV